MSDLNALLDDLKRRMDGALDSLRRDFSGLRSGRASPALLEPVRVEAYGGEVPLTQVGSIAVPEARMITVQVWDRALAGAVERAIRDSGLGLNPAGEGQTIRVPIPQLTEERRNELAKAAARYAEGGKVAMPLEKTFWAERFGMCTDRFGVSWMVNCEMRAPET